MADQTPPAPTTEADVDAAVHALSLARDAFTQATADVATAQAAVTAAQQTLTDKQAAQAAASTAKDAAFAEAEAELRAFSAGT